MKNKKWFGVDYSDYYIKEEQSFNVCGEQIDNIYCIKIAEYFFGIKYYIVWGKYLKGERGCYYYKIYKKDKEELIKEFKKIVVSTKLLKHKIDICQEQI